MKDKFIDYICKLTSIPRFTGSYLVQPQSGADHAFRVTMIALQMVDDYNSRNKKKISREEVLMKALLHDVEESVIGDLPSPVKYITPEFRESVRLVEEKVMKDMVLKDAGPKSKEYYKYWVEAKKDKSGKIIKIADKLEGFIKINFEIRQGNAGLIDAYHETVTWFEENEELLSPFKVAQEMVNNYRIHELDEQRK
jgi:5'-deoxynucleotidase YfbR-like HD superfamily hydrolase